MKPRVKVAKGWNYRVILVDKDGVYSWDDYSHLNDVKAAISMLIDDYRKEVHRKGSVVEI